jgi:hypothetical protein
MPTVKLSPVLNDESLDNDGLPLIGGTISVYLAGTSTLATTYTTSAGNVEQTNPIVLNARGEPDSPIWLPVGKAYTLILLGANALLLRQYDNIQGINDVDADILTPSEWVASGLTPTFINATQFSMVGDKTQVLSKYRRTKCIVAAGTAYGTITTSTYAYGITTVTQVNDGLPLDGGLSIVSYGFNTLQSSPGLIQSGTVMAFYQAAAPLGFTQVTTLANYMMRVVSTAGGGHGGTDSPILNDKIPSHVHTFTTDVENQGHTHDYVSPNTPSGTFGAGSFTVVQANTTGVQTTGESVPHVHPGTTTVNDGAANWAPKYMDFIIARKD